MERLDEMCAGGRAGWAGRAMTRPGSAAGEPALFADRDDRQLVAATLAGDREAFENLVARHQRVIVRLCARYSGSREDAADLAQEAFLRAYRGLKTFKGRSSFRTWLYRIAVNVCLNRAVERRVPIEPLASIDALPDPGETPASALLASEQAALVRRAILRLPPKQRATLVLRVYHDLPHGEIAAILGGSVGAVKANFFHALRNLGRLLGPDVTRG